jgi:hypothetical protein
LSLSRRDAVFLLRSMMYRGMFVSHQTTFAFVTHVMNIVVVVVVVVVLCVASCYIFGAV